MNYDHEAIRKAYANVSTIGDLGIFDVDGNEVTIEQSKVDAARVELNKLNYKYERQAAYPNWGDQLDYIYHNGIDKWKTDIVDPVKAKYPKPS
jgi:hypothetical protein|tara:strand:- start:89 stop:367 length:279 start_codon:yes stop_codon:yes gene_type:complete